MTTRAPNTSHLGWAHDGPTKDGYTHLGGARHPGPGRCFDNCMGSGLLAPSDSDDPTAASSTTGAGLTNAVGPNVDLPLDVALPLNPVPFSREWLTRSFDAYTLYWRGRGYYDRSTGRKPFGALPYFERAAALDSSFVLAHAGLAVSYLDRAAAGIAPAESGVKARQAAERALALDARSAETHVALAELSYRLDDDDLHAEREFVRAVQLNGQSALRAATVRSLPQGAAAVRRRARAVARRGRAGSVVACLELAEGGRTVLRAPLQRIASPGLSPGLGLMPFGNSPR